MAETSSKDPSLRASGDRQVCVLVVEDDAALRRMVVNYFEENNIRALTAEGRDEMARQLRDAEVNLVILDLRLGQEDGLDLLRDVRSKSDVPVIIITGHRRDEIDRVVGLELGADDYLTKPFNLRELLARVRAVLRRIESGRAAPIRELRPRSLPLFRLAARSENATALRSRRRCGRADQGRIRAARRIPRGAATPAKPRAPPECDPGARRRVRPQHRRADLASAAQARTRSERAANDPDRARRRICFRATGRAILRSAKGAPCRRNAILAD